MRLEPARKYLVMLHATYCHERSKGQTQASLAGCSSYHPNVIGSPWGRAVVQIPCRGRLSMPRGLAPLRLDFNAIARVLSGMAARPYQSRRGNRAGRGGCYL
jgi:hypothetical protein